MRYQDRNVRVRATGALLTAIWIFVLAGCDKPPAADDHSKIAPAPPPVAAALNNKKSEPPRVDPAKAGDAALAAKVLAALAANSRMSKFGIDVRANNGVVELFGTVDAKSSRELAERIAIAVDGVKSVKSHLVLVSGS